MTVKPRQPLTLIDLCDVIYSAGHVFDDLQCTREDTAEFLKVGSVNAIRHNVIGHSGDVALLQDLRDVAAFIINQPCAELDAAYLCALNSTITRSGPIHPGRLRSPHQHIGVSTNYGRHEPPALNTRQLDAVCRRRALPGNTVENRAISLFIDLARAQPFEDSNKRTALFAANSMLIASASPYLLIAPVDEKDSSIARSFNDHLAQAYLSGENTPVATDLREHGLVRAERVSSVASSATPDEEPSA